MIDFARPASRGDEIARLSAHIEAATGRLLALIRDFDADEEWVDEGFTSCARWLSWRTGISPGAARERVRVARALGELPALSTALSAGQVSYSVARALTRIATADNEAELLEVALVTPAADMERLVAAWKRADRSEAEELDAERARHECRGLWLVPDEDGSWRLRGRLDPEVGAALQKALDAANELLYAEDRETPDEQRRADAIGLVAEAALGEGFEGKTTRADRFQVVVHVSAETLGCDTSGETPHIEHGPDVSAETARRLACDAGIVTMTHAPDGSVLDVGRRRRSPTIAIRRALAHRDGTCRFPDCRVRFCESHHVTGWTKGGKTKLTNLLLLCRRHHRFLHEGGGSVEFREGGEVVFHRADGRPVPRIPERPVAADEPVHALERIHDRLGLEIDPWTVTPDWEGDRMDVDWAVGVLRDTG
jgi:hypothetical protein